MISQTIFGIIIKVKVDFVVCTTYTNCQTLPGQLFLFLYIKSDQIFKIMNTDLLNNISQKLHQASRQTMIQKKKEKEETQVLIKTIQTSLQDRKNRQALQIEQNHERITQLNSFLDQNIKNMHLQSSKESEKVECLREELQTRIQDAQKNHQQKVQEIVGLAQDKVISLSEEIDKKSKQQKEKIEYSLNNLSKKLLFLQKQIKEESQNRKVGAQRIKQHFYDELEQVKEVVEKQQQRRVSSQRKMATMIEQIEEKLNQQIQLQTSKRKKNNEAMLKLIQLACQKIEENSQ